MNNGYDQEAAHFRQKDQEALDALAAKNFSVDDLKAMFADLDELDEDEFANLDDTKTLAIFDNLVEKVIAAANKVKSLDDPERLAFCRSLMEATK